MFCSSPRFWEMTTENRAHVALTPRAATHGPAGSCTPQHMLTPAWAISTPSVDSCGARTLSTHPLCGWAGRVTPSGPSSYLIQVRPSLQDSVLGGTGCACAAQSQRSKALPQCPGKTRPSHRVPGSGLERRHLYSPPIARSPTGAAAFSRPGVSATYSKGMKWQAGPW